MKLIRAFRIAEIRTLVDANKACTFTGKQRLKKHEHQPLSSMENRWYNINTVVYLSAAGFEVADERELKKKKLRYRAIHCRPSLRSTADDLGACVDFHE